jgi:metal-responsive CopG/Arc/MetJ family transcriptional regulator
LETRYPTRDDKGFPQRISFDAPPYLVAELDRHLDETRDFDDRGQFIRTAIVLMMDLRERLDPPEDHPSNVGIMVAIGHENAATETRLGFIRHIQATRNSIYAHLANGAKKTAAETVRRVLDIVRRLPKDDEYRNIFEREIRAVHGDLLKQGSITGLTVQGRVPKSTEPEDED